jgi:translation initiation factor 2B subunit (eIF-2B alpha/beta/delta family)
VNADILRRLERLRTDTVSGATNLAVSAIDIALDAPEDWPQLAREFRSMHPAIVTVANVGRLLESQNPDLPGLRRSLLEGNQRIAPRLAALLPPGARILTISRSSTVEAALAGRGSSVLVLESLPGGEGRLLAESLNAKLIPDAFMGQAAARVDCALVGIDAFDADGAILHKTGTLPLALCCAHFGKPFYAAGHSFKLAPGRTADLLASRDEFTLFDRIPPELITRIITERGNFERGKLLGEG